MDTVMTLPILAPATAEIFLTIVGMVLLMAGVFRGERMLKPLSWATVASFAVAAVLVILYGGSGQAFFGLFVTEAFAQFAKILILLGSGFAILLSLGYLKNEKAGRFEYPVLILFATVGMMIMVSANDLMALYMGLEMQSLALYVIAAIRRDTATVC